ncbi:MAG: diguanylate cyclase, partial [Candidatus Caldatribacteriaceae bacterium]
MEKTLRETQKALLSVASPEALLAFLRKEGLAIRRVDEAEFLRVLLEEGPFDLCVFSGAFAHLVALFLEGIPAAAFIIDRNRRILAQNRVAEWDWKTRVGEYCFLSLHQGKALSEEDRKLVAEGKVRPGIRCVFCRADEALERQEPVRTEIEWQGKFWDVFWVPLGKDLYLHYAHDVTPYSKMAREFRELAVTDFLTGVYNRRFFMEVLHQEVERVKRRGGTFSLLFFDLDNFKGINDTLGHDVGDRVLREVATAVSSSIRDMDTLARSGGDEFLVLLPGASEPEARALVQRLRAGIAVLGQRYGFPLSASFGV